MAERRGDGGDAPPALVWLRRDLRLDDQPALAAALEDGGPVACAFVLDEGVYGGEDRAAPRVQFALDGLRDLDGRLRERGGGLFLRRGDGVEEVARLAGELGARRVHACGDYEPFARARDARAGERLRDDGVEFALHDDLTVVPHDAVANRDGSPCRTYSSYARAVGRVLEHRPIAPERHDLAGRLLAPDAPAEVPDAAALGLAGAAPDLRGGETAGLARLRRWRDGRLADYAAERNEVGDDGATSRLSAYLKLGMVSPRRCLAVAATVRARKWRAELLWRDWFKYVLHHHPDLAERSVDPRYERLEWPGTDADFEAWCRGETGYGLVDAGMRQLAETGWQPNRVRMVCASFLVKDLHVDWRRGERFYREHLTDGDLSSNAGNWQWVAGTGLDAAPYFRVFNPELQAERFDPDGAYVRRWAPDRPDPIVDHDVERRRTLDLYAAAVGRRQ
jgi:deoxyribodipyrimidine photo-lyase